MRSLAVAVALFAVGCTTEAPSKPSPPPAAPPKAAALLLGQPISAAPVALNDVARNPSAYLGRSFSTTGTVTAVCQNMGCWMEIRDASTEAHIRMHGHAFFIPKTAGGKHARVEATVVRAEDAKECDESPGHEGTPALARVELDATGVELD